LYIFGATVEHSEEKGDVKFT